MQQSLVWSNRKVLLVAAGAACLAFPGLAQARTLQQGSHGQDVRALQVQLVKKRFLQPQFVSGNYGTRTYFAVQAFQKWWGLTRDGVAGPKTQGALLRSGNPRPQGRGESTRVEIWRARQLVAFIQGGQVLRVFAISSGRSGYTTPTGRFRIYSKVRDEWSHKYNAPMPYASYFYGGIALHESADVPAYPASHGCVRVPGVWIVDVWRATPVGRQVLVLDR